MPYFLKQQILEFLKEINHLFSPEQLVKCNQIIDAINESRFDFDDNYNFD